MVESIFSSFESKWFGLKCGPFHLSQQQSVTVISSFSYLDRFSCSVAALVHHRKYLSIYLSGIPVALLLCLQISCFVCTWLFFSIKIECFDVSPLPIFLFHLFFLEKWRKPIFRQRLITSESLMLNAILHYKSNISIFDMRKWFTESIFFMAWITMFTSSYFDKDWKRNDFHRLRKPIFR